MSGLFSHPPAYTAPVIIDPSRSHQTPQSSTPESHLSTPTSTPVSLLSTPSAKLLTHLHPILLASIFHYRFSALVADPVPALRDLLIPISALQVAYTCLCLPTCSSVTGPSGQSSTGERSHNASKSSTPTPRRKLVQQRGGSANTSAASRITPSILSLLLSLSIPTLPLFAILILFGAPLTSHHQHTLLLASHISVLACQPLFFIHGVSARIWQEVLSAAVPFDVVWGGSIGCVVGAWIGAVPIPLDWDREWQKWPVTIVVGAYVGFVVGRYAGEYLLKGRRIEMGVAEEAGD